MSREKYGKYSVIDVFTQLLLTTSDLEQVSKLFCSIVPCFLK